MQTVTNLHLSLLHFDELFNNQQNNSYKRFPHLFVIQFIFAWIYFQASLVFEFFYCWKLAERSINLLKFKGVTVACCEQSLVTELLNKVYLGKSNIRGLWRTLQRCWRLSRDKWLYYFYCNISKPSPHFLFWFKFFSLS